MLRKFTQQNGKYQTEDDINFSYDTEEIEIAA